MIIAHESTQLGGTGGQVDTKRDTVRIKIATFLATQVDQLKPDFSTLVLPKRRHLLGKKINLKAVSENGRFDPHCDESHLVGDLPFN